jgi:hypothetical protein
MSGDIVQRSFRRRPTGNAACINGQLPIRTRTARQEARCVSDAVGGVESFNRRCCLIDYFAQVLRDINRAMRNGIEKACIDAVAGGLPPVFFDQNFLGGGERRLVW